MRQNQVHSKVILKERRRQLRETLTPAEAALWTLLKTRKLDGFRFRKQHSIENYIVDFYCPAAKLIVELDGEVHNNEAQFEYDRQRDTRLKELGFTVLRFENKWVFESTQMLLDMIMEHLPRSSQPPPNIKNVSDSS